MEPGLDGVMISSSEEAFELGGASKSSGRDCDGVWTSAVKRILETVLLEVDWSSLLAQSEQAKVSPT